LTSLFKLANTRVRIKMWNSENQQRVEFRNVSIYELKKICKQVNSRKMFLRQIVNLTFITSLSLFYFNFKYFGNMLHSIHFLTNKEHQSYRNTDEEHPESFY